MTMNTHVCLRCGVAVRPWRTGWKHCANQHMRSCRQRPAPVSRHEYEMTMRDGIQSVVEALTRAKAQIAPPPYPADLPLPTPVMCSFHPTAPATSTDPHSHEPLCEACVTTRRCTQCQTVAPFGVYLDDDDGITCATCGHRWFPLTPEEQYG